MPWAETPSLRARQDRERDSRHRRDRRRAGDRPQVVKKLEAQARAIQAPGCEQSDRHSGKADDHTRKRIRADRAAGEPLHHDRQRQHQRVDQKRDEDPPRPLKTEDPVRAAGATTGRVAGFEVGSRIDIVAAQDPISERPATRRAWLPRAAGPDRSSEHQAAETRSVRSSPVNGRLPPRTPSAPAALTHLILYSRPAFIAALDRPCDCRRRRYKNGITTIHHIPQFHDASPTLALVIPRPERSCRIQTRQTFLSPVSPAYETFSLFLTTRSSLWTDLPVRRTTPGRSLAGRSGALAQLDG